MSSFTKIYITSFAEIFIKIGPLLLEIEFDKFFGDFFTNTGFKG